MHDTLRRHRALEKTRAKYRGKPLDWRKADCVRMARTHLVAMGRKGLPKIPAYTSPAGAKRALKSLGFDTLEQLLDSLLPRIAPAMLLPGDLALVQGDEHFDALMICVGHRLYGWSAQNGCREPVDLGNGNVPILSQVKAAYRA